VVFVVEDKNNSLVCRNAAECLMAKEDCARQRSSDGFESCHNSFSSRILNKYLNQKSEIWIGNLNLRLLFA